MKRMKRKLRSSKGVAVIWCRRYFLAKAWALVSFKTLWLISTHRVSRTCPSVCLAAYSTMGRVSTFPRSTRSCPGCMRSAFVVGFRSTRPTWRSRTTTSSRCWSEKLCALPRKRTPLISLSSMLVFGFMKVIWGFYSQKKFQCFHGVPNLWIFKCLRISLIFILKLLVLIFTVKRFFEYKNKQREYN